MGGGSWVRLMRVGLPCECQIDGGAALLRIQANENGLKAYSYRVWSIILFVVR
jgi:hypothetical protein